DLHEIDAAQQGRRGEPGDIADHPSAERHQHRPALDAAGEDVIDEPAEMGEVLGRLAGWQHDLLMADALRIEAGAQRREMMVRDCRVGDDHRLTAPHQRKDLEARAGDQAGADQDVIATVAELDAQPRSEERRVGKEWRWPWTPQPVETK